MTGRVNLNGEIVDWEEAKVHVTTHAFNYGTGIFEGIRAYWVPEDDQLNVFRLSEHAQRMITNTTLLRMDPPLSVPELSEEILALLRENGPEEDTYVRPIIYYGAGGIGVAPTTQEVQYLIFTQALGNYFGKEGDPGLNVAVASWTRIADNMYPARGKILGAYVNSALAKLDAHVDGYDEAIFMTKDGFVSEGSGENLFIVRDGVLITPPVTADILEGITRDSVITMARDMGFEVKERNIQRTELYIADEVFLVGTAAEVAPVLSVDKRPVSNGEMGTVTGKLRQAFFDAAKGKDPQYKDWVTPVY